MRLEEGGSDKRMVESRQSLVVFDVAGRRCALPAGAVREVVHYAELSRAPGMPAILDGFLNYGGTVLPVVRVARLFGFNEIEPGLYAPIVVLRGTELALLVDEVLGVVSVDGEAILPLDGDSVFNACLAGQIELEDGAVHVLVPERLVLEQERRRLDELGAMMAERLAAVDEAAT